MAGRETSEQDAEPEGEVTLAAVGGAVETLARSHRHSSLLALVALLVVGAAAAGRFALLNARLAALETGPGGRSTDLARIQDQAAKTGAGVELLHREIAQLRGELGRISREVRRRSDE